MHTKSDHHFGWWWGWSSRFPHAFVPPFTLSGATSSHPRLQHILVPSAPKVRVMNFFLCVIASSSFLWCANGTANEKKNTSCWTYIGRRPLILYEWHHKCSKITLHSKSTYQSCVPESLADSINPCFIIDHFHNHSKFTFDYPPLTKSVKNCCSWGQRNSGYIRFELPAWNYLASKRRGF